MDILWTSGTSNRKTGNVPTGWIGSNIEEARQSCTGCPLLDNGCYAHQGSPRIGFASLTKAFNRGLDRSFKTALRLRHKKAKMIRLGALGDPSAATDEQIKEIVETSEAQKISLVGYTHFWRRVDGARWRGKLMASCDTKQDLVDAIKDGWRATVVVPPDYPQVTKLEVDGKTHTLLVCPAQMKEKVTCNDCRLCDASKKGPHIAFRVHGIAMNMVDFTEKGL